MPACGPCRRPLTATALRAPGACPCAQSQLARTRVAAGVHILLGGHPVGDAEGLQGGGAGGVMRQGVERWEGQA